MRSKIKSGFVFSAVFVSIFALSFLACSSFPASAGVVAQWNFNEGNGDMVVDSSGNGHNGTIHGATRAYGLGINGSDCLSFDGTSSYVSIPNSSAFNLSDGVLSIEFWFKPGYDLTDTTPYMEILAKEDGTFGGGGWRVDLINKQTTGSGGVEFCGYAPGNYQEMISLNTNWSSSSWYHVVMTWDGTTDINNAMKVYVNGVQERKLLFGQIFDTNPRITSNSYDLIIGAIYQWGVRANYNGLLDDISIYNNVLTADEIKAHYNAAAGNPNTFPGTDVTVEVNGVMLKFANVTSPGITRVVTSDAGPALPGIFELFGTYYDLSSTAIYSGSIEVSFPYDDTGLTPEEEQALKIVQYDNQLGWVDITTSVNTTNNIITALAPHLSRFAKVKSLANTKVGDNVELNLNGISIAFAQVTAPGLTTVTATTERPHPLSDIYGVIGNYYNVSTNATYSGNIKITIPYNDAGLTPDQEQRLKLHQYDFWGNLYDIVTSLDTVHNIITGETFSLTNPRSGWFFVTKLMDTTAPEIHITSPQAKAYANTTGTIPVEYTLSDNKDPLDMFAVNGLLDGNYLDMQYNAFIDITSLALGQHMLTLEAYDYSGNLGRDTVIFEVKTSTIPLSSFVIKNLQVSFKPETPGKPVKSDKVKISGKLALPSPYTKADILPDVTVMLEIGSTSGTDTVLANTKKERWIYNRKKFEVPADANLDIKRLKIKWGAKEGTMDTYNIEGFMDADNDNSGNVTLTLVMPLKAGGDITGSQTVTCKTSKRSWEYNLGENHNR
jgi:hypothetical protein